MMFIKLSERNVLLGNTPLTPWVLNAVDLSLAVFLLWAKRCRCMSKYLNFSPSDVIGIKRKSVISATNTASRWLNLKGENISNLFMACRRWETGVFFVALWQVWWFFYLCDLDLLTLMLKVKFLCIRWKLTCPSFLLIQPQLNFWFRNWCFLGVKNKLPPGEKFCLTGYIR
jgi:hypothetical protein